VSSHPPLRVFAGGISTETNSFSPIPTGYDDYERHDPSSFPDEWKDSTFLRIRDTVVGRGHTYLQGPYASAVPSGLTTDATYERLKTWLLDELGAVIPVDAVLLVLHGAMATPSVDDCEADLVGAVRRLVGGASVGVLLDLHCDVSEALVESADVIVIYKEYPHIDIDMRAAEMAEITLRAAEGDVHPTMATFDSRTAGLVPTTVEPMRSFVDDVLCGVEKRDGVLSASLAHGFPWADTVAYGSRALVITDGDSDLAYQVAEELGRGFYAIRRHVLSQPIPLEDAIRRLTSDSPSQGPVVLADIADNAGGGASSDSTFILGALIEHMLEDVALGPLWDPQVVHTAFAAGVGATLRLRVGGKTGTASGQPLDVVATVVALRRGLVQRWPQVDGFTDVPAGDCAALRIDGVTVVVNSLREQAVGLNLFTDLSIDPSGLRAIVVKSAHHYRAAFGPIASEMISVNTPGALRQDLTALEFARADLNRYPWIEDPLGTG